MAPLQGYKVNPGAQQVTSRGAKQPLGGSGSGKGAPSKNTSLPSPANAKYSPKAVRAQQLQPGRHASYEPGSDYAGDGKSYGTPGSKTLRNPATSSAFNKNSPGRGR